MKLLRPAVRQSGASLIEVLGALMIGAVMLFGLMGMIDRSLDDMKGQGAAAYQAQLTNAARKYIEANAPALSLGTAPIQTVTVDQLRVAGFLPANFANENNYGQGACVLIRKLDPSPSDPAGPIRLDALVVGTGDGKIPDKDLPAVALQAGPGGGYIATTEPEIARGATWSINTGSAVTGSFRNQACPGGTTALTGAKIDGGHLVSSLFYDGAGQLATDFLYRGKVDGKPELNTMSTPLLMGATALVTAGGPCVNPSPSSVPLAIDAATRAVVTCGVDGFWSASGSWKAPKDSYLALAALTDAKLGDVRMITDKNRAFTFNSAGKWVPLAIDEDGNFDVPGLASADNVQSRGRIDAEGEIHAVGHLATDADLHVGQNAYITGTTAMEKNVTIGIFNNDGSVQQYADVKATGVVTAEGVAATMWMGAPALQLYDKQTPGAKCNYEKWDAKANKNIIQYPYGTIAMDEFWRPLICGPNNYFVYANGQTTL